MVATRRLKQRPVGSRDRKAKDVNQEDSSSLGSSNTTADAERTGEITSSSSSSSESQAEVTGKKLFLSTYPRGWGPIFAPSLLPTQPLRIAPRNSNSSDDKSANPIPNPSNFTGNSSSGKERSSSNSDDSSQDSNDVAWNPIHGMILHTAVAAYANFAEYCPRTREINLEKLDWERIADHFPDRSAIGCYRYWKTMNPDTVLSRTATGVGYTHKNVAEGLSSGSGEIGASNTMQQVAEEPRAVRRRRNKRKKIAWTSEEEEQIDQLQQELGNKWTRIAAKLGTGRSGNDVKNYWHSVKDKIIEKRFRKENISSKST